MDRPSVPVTTARRVLPAVVAVVGIAGCAQGAPAAAPGAASSAAPSAASSAASSAPSSSPEPTDYPLCAEFPVQYGPQDPHVGAEGWWNGSPADASGRILRDPADWPREPREHPRVALVATDDGTVLETWDRTTCGEDLSYVYVPGDALPAGSIAVVDMDTGEVVEVFGWSGAGQG